MKSNNGFKLVKQPIKLPPVLGVTAQAEKDKQRLVASLSSVGAVGSAAEQESAVAKACAARGYVKAVNECRLALTRPLDELKGRLKKLADDHVAPVQAGISRVEDLVGEFQRAEQDRVRKEEEARAAEIDRLTREAEAAREGVATAQAMADLDAAAAAEKELAAAVQAQTTAIVAPVPEAAKARGATLTRKLRYEVVDVAEVYRHRPDLVKMEIKASAVLATCVPERPVPGLRLWWEDVLTTRATPAAGAFKMVR